MADSTSNGQINFSADLSALNEFIQTLQNFVNQSNTTDPVIQRLTTLFNELNNTVVKLNGSFQSFSSSSNITSDVNSMIDIVNSLKNSFNGLNGGSRGLASFTNNITRMSQSLERLNTLSSQFNSILTQIDNRPGVNNRQMLDFFNRLQTLLTNVTNSFKSLISVSNEVDQLNNFLKELISTFNQLNSVSGQFNQLMNNTQGPANIQQSETYFRELIVLIERLNIMYNGLSNATGGLTVIASGVRDLDNIMRSLVSVTEQFNTVLSQTSSAPASMNISPYFEQLMTAIYDVDVAFRSVLTDSSNLVRINEQFNSIESAVRSLANTATQLDVAIQRTSDAPDSSQLESYFVHLSELIARLNVEFKNFAGVNKHIEQVSTTFKDLNKIVTQIGKITTKLGGPDDVAKMEANFNSLIGVIKKLVEEVNKLDMSSKNFDKLNEVLRNLSQTLKSVSSSNSQTSKGVSDINNGVRTLGMLTNNATSSVGGFFRSFDASFGSRPLNMLSKMHMGVNSIRFGIQGLIMSLGGRELWDWLIGTNQQIEVLQSSLEVTLKSAQSAENAIRSLRSYAALTPFQEMETFEAGEMLAANRMDIDKWIRVAGDLASAKKTAGVEINDVINVLTRINSGDFGKAMIRLRQMGISLKDLREKGLEFTKSNTYKGDTEQMLAAIEQIVEERYGGLTEKLGTTTEGLISTIKDFFLQLGIQMGDETFGKLRSWLATIKIDLQDFQNSMQFKKIIQGFNTFMDGMIGFLKPFVDILGKVGILLANNLPLIGRLVQLFTTLSLTKSGLTFFQNIAQGISNLSNNWMKINIEANQQVALLKEQGIILQNHQIQLAKINALRKAGSQIINEQNMSQMVQAELAAVGGVNATSASKVGAKIGGLAAGVGSVIPQVMAVIAGMQILGGVIDSVVRSLKRQNRELDNSVKDYDRMISQEIEEQRALERLNSTRIASNETIRYYNELQERANAITAEGTFTEEQKADITNRLVDAQNQLIRVNEQIIEIAPDLVGGLTDETGALTDQTGAFDLNTEAIQRNISAKNQRIDQMHKDQVEAAKAENEILRQQMADDQKTLELANDRSGGHVATGWVAKVFGEILGIVGLNPVPWIADEATQKALDLTTGSESDRLKFEQQTKIQNIERNRKIQENEKIIKEAEDATNAGFMDQNGVINWSAYREWQKRQQEKLDELQNRLKATPQTFIDEVSATDEELQRIERTYDIQLQEELIRNGNDTEAEAYKKIETKKAVALQKYIDQSLADIEEIYTTAKSGWDNQIGRVSGSLRALLDDGLEPEAIIRALEQGNESINTLYLGRQTIIDNLTQLYEDLKEKGLQPRDIHSITNDYQTVMEAEMAYKDAIDALRLKRAQVGVKVMDKSKKERERSPLQEFNDKWNQEKQQVELKKDITLQVDQIVGYNEGSAVYEAHRKQQSRNIYEFLTEEISALKDLLKSGTIKEAKERYQAQTQLLQLDKERNALLLDIKKNTSKLEEFNKPGLVRAITYYDYKSKDADSSTIEIGDAKFVMQIQSLQTIDDVNKMMDAIRQYLGTFIKKTESAGYANPQLIT